MTDTKDTNSDVDYTSNEVLQQIEKWEQFDSEKKELSERVKEFKAENKALGFDNKILGKIVKLRARTPESIAEEEALTDTYKRAIGME